MRLRVILLGFVAFALALLVVLPAAWIKDVLPAQISCAAFNGSIWRGQCSALAYAEPNHPLLRLDSVDWKLHALALLRGRASAQLAITGPALAAQGEIILQSGGRISVTGLTGTIALDHARLAALPAGWSAQAEAQNLSIDIVSGRIAALGGVLLAHQLRDAEGTAYGDFRLEFKRQDAAPFHGTLTDQGAAGNGPLQLKSQLTLNADQSWQMHGTVMLRPGSPPRLATGLDQLAPADLNGLRSFSLEGTAR